MSGAADSIFAMLSALNRSIRDGGSSIFGSPVTLSD